MNKTQTDLEGKTMDVEEIEELRKATIYVAGNFRVRVSETMEEKFDNMDAGKKKSWLKRSMRIIDKNKDPAGKEFDEDLKALYSVVFGS